MLKLATPLELQLSDGQLLRWRQAVAAAPNAPQYRLQLARLQLQAGEKDAARAELDKLQSTVPPFPWEQARAIITAELGRNRYEGSGRQL